jgi:hypothetical protein
MVIVTYIANEGQVIVLGPRHFSLSGTTTVYAHAYTSFTPGSCTVYAYLFGVKLP